MIKLIFFAKYREQFGTDCLELNRAGFDSVRELIRHLRELYPERCSFLDDSKLIVSIQQELVRLDNPVKEGDVVAFFPPVTGG